MRTQKPAGDALAEKQVTVNPPNGSFETEFAVPADKLQPGKKYVIEASIDGQEQSEVTEYITVKPLAPLYARSGSSRAGF